MSPAGTNVLVPDFVTVSTRRTVVMSTLLLVGLASCGTTTGKIFDRLELSTTHTAAGPTIKAALVIYNPGFAMNLTPTGGCEPYFAVFLSSARATQEIGFDKDCQSTPLVIAHGTTRFPFTVETTYTHMWTAR
jgi:hypothetical protein